MVEDTEAAGVIITLLKDKSTINHRKLLLHCAVWDETLHVTAGVFHQL